MTSRSSRSAFDAAFWFQWIMATTVGWLVGSLLFPVLPAVSGGVGVGLLQWPVLYRRLPQAWRWMVVTAIGWIGGMMILWIAVPSGLQSLLTGLIVGPAVGLAQWLLLRREVCWAGWWIAISTLAWITGLTLLPGMLSTGALVGAVGGLALILLWRTPR